MTITLGWWLLPSLVTLAAWVWASRWRYRSQPHVRNDFYGTLSFGAAAIVGLAVWLAYFVALVVWG